MNGAEKQLAILCINETGVSARKLRAYASEKEATGATFNEGRCCTSLVVIVKERLNHFGIENPPNRSETVPKNVDILNRELEKKKSSLRNFYPNPGTVLEVSEHCDFSKKNFFLENFLVFFFLRKKKYIFF